MSRLRGAAWVFGGQAYSLLLALPSGILLARGLGAAGKGTITVVQLIAAMSTVILGLGLPGMFTYLGARREIDGQTVARTAWAWATAVALILASATAVFGAEIAQLLFDAASVQFVAAGAVAAAPVMVMSLNGAYLMGLGQARTYSLLNASVQSLQLAGFFALLLLGLFTPWSAILVWMAAALAGAIAGTRIVLGIRADAPITTVPQLFHRGWRFGIASWFASGLGLLSWRIDVLLISSLLGTAAVGLYSIAVTLAELAWQLPSAMYAVMFPKISAEGASSAEVTARVNRSLWPLALLVSTAIAVAGIWLVPLLFGREFSASVPSLWLLVPGITASAMGIVPSAYLAGIGRPGVGAWSSGINIVANVGLNLVLIPSFGIAGAAAASSISYAAGASLLVYSFMRETGISLRDSLLPRSRDVREAVDAAVRVIDERRSVVRGKGGTDDHDYS